MDFTAVPFSSFERICVSLSLSLLGSFRFSIWLEIKCTIRFANERRGAYVIRWWRRRRWINHCRFRLTCIIAILYHSILFDSIFFGIWNVCVSCTYLCACLYVSIILYICISVLLCVLHLSACYVFTSVVVAQSRILNVARIAQINFYFLLTNTKSTTHNTPTNTHLFSFFNATNEKNNPPIDQPMHRNSVSETQQRQPRQTPDWGENAVAGDHLWSPTSISGDFCYVGDTECTVRIIQT